MKWYLYSVAYLLLTSCGGEKLVYHDFQNLSGLTLNGSAKKINQKNDGILHLTNNYWQSSSVFYTKPVTLTRNASFSTYFQFKISDARGAGGGADGIVFILQTQDSKVGAVGGGIGYQGIKPSIGIEFDTYNNGVDYDANHIGINIDGSMTSVSLHKPSRRLDDGSVWHAWVDYDGQLLSLRVSSSSARPDAANLSYEIDLSKKFAQQATFVGFSSGTGAGAGNHDILAWEFRGYFSEIDESQTLKNIILSLLALSGLLGGAAAVKKLRENKDEFKAQGIHVKISFPALKKSRNTGGFALPADSINKDDKRPVSQFEILVVERKDKTLQPVDDGTEIQLTVKSLGSGEDVPKSKADIDINGKPAGMQTRASTNAGKIHGKLFCGPGELMGQTYSAAPAERWKIIGNDITYSAATTFELAAKLTSGESGTCIIEIIPGAAHVMELMGAPENVGIPSAVIQGPDGNTPKAGESLLAVKGMRFMVATVVGAQLKIQRKKRMIRFGGWLKSRALKNTAKTKNVEPVKFVADQSGSISVPATTALVGMIAQVTDIAGNPYPLPPNKVFSRGRPLLRFPWAKSSGSQSLPYVMSANSPGKPGDPKKTKWASGSMPPFPDNVFLAFIAPCYAVNGGAETHIEVSIKKAAWRFSIKVEPSTDSAKFNHWFVSGDIPSKEYFLGEIALSLVPFIGDGRDLVIYGIKFINDEKLSGVDHAVAVLSLAGLVLDFVPVAIKFNAAAASAKSAVKLLRKIPEEPAQQLAKAISEHMAKGVSNIDDLSKLKELPGSKEFEQYKESIRQLGYLGDAIKKAETIKVAQRLLTVMGLVVLTVGLAPLLEILAKYTIEETIDLLEGLYNLDKKESQ